MDTGHLVCFHFLFSMNRIIDLLACKLCLIYQRINDNLYNHILFVKEKNAWQFISFIIAAIGFMVDAVRITTYAFLFFAAGAASPVDVGQWPLILAAIVFAFAGVLAGKRYLRKVTMKSVQTLTGILLTCIALLLGLGII
jgi:hypothetical protein